MESEKNIKIAGSRLLFADAFFLGFTLLGAQIILLREFLMIYNGNELVIGLLLSIWLLITALGSWSGRYLKAGKNYDNLIRILFLFISIYPLAAAFSIEYFRNVLLEPGRMVSLTEVAGYSTLLLFPLCFSGGFLFNLINVASGKGKGILQNCYALESLGSLVGGIIISLFFIFYLQISNFRSLEYLMILNLIFFGIHDFREGKLFESFVFVIITLFLMMFIFKYEPNEIAKRKLFAGQEILMSKETAYGNLTITKTKDQMNFFENGVLLFSTGDIAQREEDIHYAMLQRPDARRVLLIGGGMTGTTLEVLKYKNVKRLDYLEVNPAIFELTKKYTDYLNDKRIRNYAEDPIIYIKKTTEKYDVIFVNQPPPSSAELNRFFTVEFYKRLKRLLLPGGVVSTRLTSSENYMSNDEVELQTSIYNSIRKSFKNVLVVPGKKLYFLASDSALSIDFAKRYKEQQIKNKYVNDAYLNDALIRFRSDQVVASYTDSSLLNHDFKPFVYLLYIRHWLSFYKVNIWVIPVVYAILALLFLVFSKPYATAMFTSGFTGAGTEILLLIAFQVIFGYVYLFLGVIITLFMAGLTVGSLMSRNCDRLVIRKRVMKIQLITGGFILLLAIYLSVQQLIQNDSVIRFLFSLFMMSIAFLVGYQYGVIVCDSKKSTAKTVASIYASDLIGSALGSFLVAVYFIPVYGLITTLLILSGFHFLTLFILTIKHKLKYL
ncbi:MAG: hypothetical protein GXO86_02250 [Chlorobi bacterium]|nr:hypothetical protein [Chlorobiota bacterium]